MYESNLKRLVKIFIALPLGVSILGFSSPTFAGDAPSKQFIKRDVPISWILDEWYRKNPNIPLYACVCTKVYCDNSQSWPFRSFTIGGVVPALGSYNKNQTERIGFVCGQVDAKEIEAIKEHPVLENP